MGSPLEFREQGVRGKTTIQVLRRSSALKSKVCALTNIVLGISERQVIIMAPYLPDGPDGPWELREVARVSGGVFDTSVASFGRDGRITGMEPFGRRTSSIRVFNFQTFVATRSEQDVQTLVERLPFLRYCVGTARRCMTDGDERVEFLRGTGSMNALLRPSIAC